MPNNYLNVRYKQARGKILSISKQTEIEILKVYQQAGKDLIKKFNKTKAGSNATRAYYAGYIRNLNSQINDIIKTAGLSSAEVPAGLQREMMQHLFHVSGIDTTAVQEFKPLFKQIPHNSIARIIDGSIYKDTTTLSDRIWGASLKAGEDIQGIINAGLAKQTSAAELSKALQAYVDPAIRKTWDRERIREILGDGYARWNKNLEYNSLRLARTTITHSAQLSHTESCKANPFVEAIQWFSVLAHKRTCDLCRDRHQKIYKVNEVPFDHPNGLCYQTAVIEKSMSEITDELSKWVKGGESNVLDNWFEEFGQQMLPEPTQSQPSIDDLFTTFTRHSI